MTITLYGIKTCDTCRKARRLLDDRGIDYRYHDLREDGLDRHRLEAFLARTDWQSLLNTRSTTWRQLDDADKQNLDAESATALMLEHPTLLKRPVLECDDDHDNAFVVGFDKTRYAALSD